MAKKTNKGLIIVVIIVILVFMMQGGKKEAKTTPSDCGTDQSCLNCINQDSVCWYSFADDAWFERGYGYANGVCTITTYIGSSYSSESECEANLHPPGAGCTDSDGGPDIYEKGTTTSSQGSLTDECWTSTSVHEYTCSGNNIFDDVIDCPGSYICSNGACKISACDPPCPPPETIACGTLPDPYEGCFGPCNIGTKDCVEEIVCCQFSPTLSQTVGFWVIEESECTGWARAIRDDEFCCGNNICDSTLGETTSSCSDDCEIPSCTDSDGQNFKTRGSVTYDTGSVLGPGTTYDTCLNDGTTLVEQICIGNAAQEITKDCRDFGSDWICESKYSGPPATAIIYQYGAITIGGIVMAGVGVGLVDQLFFSK